MFVARLIARLCACSLILCVGAFCLVVVVVVACLKSCLFFVSFDVVVVLRLLHDLFVFCVCYLCPLLVLFVVVCLFDYLFVLFAFLYVFDVCAFVLRVSCVCVLVRCV